MTLLSILPAIAAHLAPGPRAEAIVASLREIAALPEASEVPWHALDAAFEALTDAWPGDGPRESARRATLGEIHKAISCAPEFGLAPVIPSRSSALRMALPWFDAQAQAWTGSENPRHAAMAATAAREARELRTFLHSAATQAPMDEGRWA
jgi:hypothetical protein